MLIQKVSSQIPHQRVGGESFPDPFFLSSVPSPPCGNGKKTKGFALYILVYMDTCIEEKHPPAPWGHTGHSPRRKMIPVCPVLCHHRWLQSSPSPPVCFSLFLKKKKNFHFFILFFLYQGKGSFYTRGLLMKAADTPRGLGSPNRAQCQAEGRMLSPGWARLGTPEQGFFIPNAGRVWSSRALAMKDMK